MSIFTSHKKKKLPSPTETFSTTNTRTEPLGSKVGKTFTLAGGKRVPATLENCKVKIIDNEPAPGQD